ncbi:hypothetical protein TL16_g04487 [Triparma laevis f. inornata]|uniref:IPT/TIG domain-containing protein n=1 Tax=Triparma laevis f. inornata TaxID=1714386 RepID=A0A9W7E5C9_9STRA|nr:hypothetical protein TL16_g04487 [Triparma laevis f. inornata]
MCKFGDTTVTGLVVSSSIISCTAPTHEATTVPVMVSINGGADYSAPGGMFQFRSALHITSVLPNGALTDSSSMVTVFGSNFENSKMLSCKFGSVISSNVVFISSTHISCETPTVLKPVEVAVEISNNGNDFTNDGVDFEFFGHPAVASVSPSSGDKSGGTLVTITGRNFMFGERTVCRFGFKSVHATYIDSNTLECVSPKQEDLHGGDGIIVEASNNDLDFTDSGISWTYTELPQVVSVSPSSGIVGGSSVLTLRGSNFVSTGKVWCRFQAKGKGILMTTSEGSFGGAGEVLCTTPTRLSESLDEYFVEVSTNNFDFSRSMNVFSYRPRAVVFAASPLDGPTTGGSVVTITGNNFYQTAAPKCRFGDGTDDGEIVPARFVNSQTYECITGDLSGVDTGSMTASRPVYITLNGADFEYTGFKFNFIRPHTVSSVSPVSGTVMGGTAVSVFGANFLQSQYIECQFGDYATTPGRFISSSQLICATPVHKVGVVDVKVSMNGKDFVGAEIPVDYEFVVGVEVNSVEPRLGDFQGGAVVTVGGKDFVDSVDLGCKFGDVVSSSATFVDSETVLCVAPESAQNKLLGLNQDSVWVGVTINGADYSATRMVHFIYVHQPSVATVAPEGVFEQVGGVKLLISGGNFIASTDLKCGFGGSALLTDARWLSDSLLQCVTPSNLTAVENGGETKVYVTNNGGAEMSSSFAALTVMTKDHGLSLEPEWGTVEGDTLVVVSGHRMKLSAESACLFGGVKVPMQIHPTLAKNGICRSPRSEEVGVVAVSVTSDGIYWSEIGDYEFKNAPVVHSISPSLGSLAGATVVTLSGVNLADSSSCRFGADGTVMPVIGVPSASQEVCASPALVRPSGLLSTGAVDNYERVVEVIGAGGDVTKSEMLWKYHAVVKVLNAYPRSGPNKGNTTVLLNGRNFVDSPGLSCKFGVSENVQARFISSTQVSCVTAEVETTGSVDVSVSLNGADFSASVTSFYFDAPIQVASMTPTFGPVRGGTVVVLTASNLRWTGAVSCKFGDSIVVGSVLSNSEISCVVPPQGSVGDVAVAVSLNGVDYENAVVGQGVFTYVPTPEVVAISPKSGWRDGGVELTVSAKHLIGSGLGDLKCSFGSKTGSVETAAYGVNEALDTVKCLTPPQKQSSSSEVNDLDNWVGVSLVYESSPKVHDASGPLFRYLDVMLVDRIVPASGSHLGGTRVHVYGDGFLNEKDLVCVFGTETSTATFISEGVIECGSPAWDGSGALSVSVASLDDSVRTFRSMAKFSYFGQPHVESVSPSWGSRSGGTVVTVVGSSFDASIDGSLNDARNHQVLCRFGADAHAVPARYLTSQTVVCESPMAKGDVVVGSGDAEVALEVSLNGGFDWTISGISFTYTEKMRLASLSPARGGIKGGTSVTILGTGFSEVVGEQVNCHFGGAVVVGEVIVGGGSVVCNSPASYSGRSAEVEVEVSFGVGHNDKTSSKLFWSYFEDVIVGSVSPTSGLIEGSVPVSVFGARFINSPTLSCKFGGVEASSALFVNTGLIKCFTPAWTGSVDVAQKIVVSLNGVDYVDSASTFTFRNFPNVLEVSPVTVSANGGTLVTLTGRNLGQAVACKFGVEGARSRAGMVGVEEGGEVVKCMAPSLGLTSNYASSAVGVWLSTGGSFFDSGVVVNYDALKSASSVYVETLGEGDSMVRMVPVVKSIYPTRVSASIETEISVYGDQLVNRAGLGCAFGNTFVEGVFISAGEIKCVSPVRMPGVVVLEVVQGGTGYYSVNNLEFTFTVDVSISSVFPKSGPVVGGTVVSVYGSNLVENGVTVAGADESEKIVLCRFGGVRTPAIMFNNNEIKCVTPPAIEQGAPGMVKLDISSNNGTSWSHSFATFGYERLVEVKSLNPNRGLVDGGSQILVEGYRFKNTTGLSCKFGETIVSAVYISETQLFCTSPPRISGDVELEVSVNGVDFSWTFVRFEYYNRLAVTDIWPKMGGSLIGNTLVSVFGSGFEKELEMACRFGQVLVPAKVLAAGVAVCATPAHMPSLVSFDLLRDGVNGNKETASGVHQFLYVRDPSVRKIVPAEGKVDGGTPVFVLGTNFVNTTALACKFGGLRSRATIVSSNMLVCVSPSVPRRLDVELTVSVNGLDYGGGGVKYGYRESCETGHYCGPSASDYNTPAPNGTYVRSAGAVNFTLCEAGYFQPRQGMETCLACPVSYFCPVQGLSKPVICPAGWVCDEMGLVTPVSPCPAGHYCKEGTKTIDVGSFEGEMDWQTDAETGLTTVLISDRPWSLINRPMPETGSRRIEHPPTGGTTAERPHSCPVGSYCKAGVSTDLIAPFNYSTPQRCFDGFFCPRGSPHPQGSGPCPTGYYCPSQTSSIVCPTGHYCPGIGNLKPVECYPGTFNPNQGMSNCTLCATGHICPGWGRLLPETCPAGFVCPSLGLSVPGVLCPPGYYCEEGTLTIDPSDPYIKGPKACSDGVFCLGGVAHNITVDWVPAMKTGVSAPQICTEGSYCQSASTSPSGSGPCFPGHYCPPGSVYPTKVPLGNFASREGSVASSLCFPGSYAPLRASVLCRQCPAGYTCQGYGTYEPRICEAGTFRSKADSVTCRLCPAGTFSPYKGATDITQCFPCPSGRVCGVQGMQNMASSVGCPGGYTCGAGTNRANQFTHKCPAGHYCAPNTVPEKQFDLVCEKGHYCLRGTPLYLATRNKCNVRFFCPPGTSAPDSPLSKCPKRTVSLTGASELSQCMIEEVDVCDKGQVGDMNPFEDRSYYPKHSYSLLSYDTAIYDAPPVVEFNSGREKNPTGEIEVLRKIIPVNESSSIDFFKNDTVEVFRTCTPYGLEDDEDEIIVVGRNFRDNSLLTCRFTACLQSDWSRGDSPFKDTDYFNQPRYCRNFDGSLADEDSLGKRKIITKATYISPTRVRCKLPKYSFNMTGGYSWMERHNPYQEVMKENVGGNEYTYDGSYQDEEDNYIDYFDIEGGPYESPVQGGGANPNPFQGKCKRDFAGEIYYLQKCHPDEVSDGRCVCRDTGLCGGGDFGSERELWFGDFVDTSGKFPPGTGEGAANNNLKFSHTRLYSLVIDCTQGEIDEGYCDNIPEIGQRLNPCLTSQIMVEVSNNGIKFSNDDLVYKHTVESDDPTRQGENQKDSGYGDYKISGTFTTYTYISLDKSEGSTALVSDPGALKQFKAIKETDKQVCTKSTYGEEGDRSREAGWFEFPTLSYAQLSFDFRNIPQEMVYNEHYKIAIYVAPSRCDDEWCNSETRMRMPPREVIPCLQPIDMPKWFLDESVNKNQLVNITLFSLEDSRIKVEVHIVHGSYVASSDFFRQSASVAITRPGRAMISMGEQLLVGSKGILGEDELSRKRMRKKSPYISWEETMIHSEFIFGIHYSKEFGEGISPPLNMPPRFSSYEKGRVLISMNSTFANEGVPTILDEYNPISNSWWEISNLYSTPNLAKEAVDTYFETFHGISYTPPGGDSFDSYSFGEFESLILPYLPFFSNCREFDSYIPLWALLEDETQCELPPIGWERDDAPLDETWPRYAVQESLPHQDDVVVVSWQDFFQAPVSDECIRTVYCSYEEVLGTPDIVPRWFETGSGDSLFEIIDMPIDFNLYTGRAETRVGREDNTWDRINGGFIQTSDNFRSVGIDRDSASEVDPSLGLGVCLERCIPRDMTMQIMYFQYTKIEKRVVQVDLIFDGTYDEDWDNKDYSITFEYFPLDWMQLIIKFAFTWDVFAVLFITIGVFTVVLCLLFWLLIRLTTQLESPPRLRFYGMLSLIVPGAFSGMGLGFLPILIVTGFSTFLLRGYDLLPGFLEPGLFGDYDSSGSDWMLFGPNPKDEAERESDWRKMHWMDPKIDPGRMVEAQDGRMGLAFLIMGAMCVYEGSHIFLPNRVSKREKQLEAKRDKNASKDSIWIPTVWKRSNLIYTSFMMVMFLTFLVEFSYWGEFGTYIWFVILFLKVVAQFVGTVIDNQLNEALLSAPVNTSLGLIQELGFLLCERVYLDPGLGDFLDFVDEQTSLMYERILRRLPKWMTGRLLAKKGEMTEQEKTDRQKEIDNMVSDGAETVEPILDSYGSYCCDTMSLLYTPFNILLLMLYRRETGIPELYGIKEQDMLYYFMFAAMIVPFQLAADILIHSCLELYHGWKIYDYLVYTRYRFLQRETRWKGLEDSLDECIEESMRTMDQMCFSSQFYVMMTIHVNGIMYMVLAIEMMIRSQYNMFGDPAFFIIFSFVVAASLATKKFLIFMALKFNLWRIKHENTAWHTTIADEDEFDIPGWDDMKGASHDAYLMNQRITSETFRYKFLNYNRAWIINQLPSILTPRTLRRSRPYLINQFTRILNAMNQDISSDSDKDDGPKFGIPILNAPTRKLLRWWLQQAQRRLKLREVVQPLINRARGTQCEQCLSRKLLQVELVIPIEELDERFQNEHPSEEFDQILWKNFWQKHARYRTVCLSCISMRKEKERREALAGQLRDDDDDDGIDYPKDWDAVYLSAASNAILLGWYKAAQNRLFGKESGKRRQRVNIQVSDDEGDELVQSWAQESLNLSESSKMIAVKWLRTARAKIQKDKGFEGGNARTRRAKPGDKYKSGKKSKTRRK